MDKVKKISEFPAAEYFNADDLLFSEQSGRARSLSGEVLQAFCRAAVDALVSRAETAADGAEAVLAAISTLQVTASTLAAEESATASVKLTEDRFLISFGIPAGATGSPGASIQSIERTAGSGTSGETDTYAITLTDGSTTTFQVYNGKDGSINFEDWTEEQRESLRGPEGPAGPVGPAGPSGYTPVRGTDYWTGEDKTEIVEDTVAALEESGFSGGGMGAIESTDYPGCFYREVDGVVEWVNPPMIPAEEYRTTERYFGKPVYVKVVGCGAGPSNGQKTIAHNVSNIDRLIHASAEAINSAGVAYPWGTYLVAYSGAIILGISANNTNIYLYANDDRSEYTVCGTLKYTKSTN